MKAIIDPQKCVCCKKCQVAAACPIKAVFRLADDEVAVVDMSLCHGCGLCISKCPVHSIALKES